MCTICIVYFVYLIFELINSIKIPQTNMAITVNSKNETRKRQ